MDATEYIADLERRMGVDSKIAKHAREAVQTWPSLQFATLFSNTKGLVGQEINQYCTDFDVFQVGTQIRLVPFVCDKGGFLYGSVPLSYEAASQASPAILLGEQHPNGFGIVPTPGIRSFLLENGFSKSFVSKVLDILDRRAPVEYPDESQASPAGAVVEAAP